MSAVKGLGQRRLLGTFLFFFLIGNTLTLSQTITNTKDPKFFQEERSIKFGTLNEFAKLLEHKKETDSLVEIHKREMKIKDEIIASKDKQLRFYENQVVPNLNASIEILRKVQENEDQKNKLIQIDLNARIKKEKRKRFGFGIHAGYGIGLQGQTPTVGVGFSWLLFKW